MNDTAVVTRLMLRDGVFLFEDQQPQARRLLARLHSNRESNDPAADYRNVVHGVCL